jgi:hypothetical protein
MAQWYRHMLAVSVVLLACATAFSSGLRAQSAPDAIVRTAGTTVNFFETIDPATPIDGGRLEMPDGWEVEEVRLLRYGATSIPVTLRAGEEGLLFTPEQPVKGPHELVVRVRLPARRGSFEWKLRTFTRKETPDTVDTLRRREVGRIAQTVTVKSPPDPDGSNRALTLSESDSPLLLGTESLPSFGGRSSFTIEFWMRTDGLDEVVLSTWTGAETVSYPAEFVVDPGGRLRLYCGEPGRHRALRSARPVANGAWHHVAAVYDAERSRLRLLVDGTPADSLRGRVSSAPEGGRLAVGGRVPSDRPTGEEGVPRLFSGHVDELRLWGTARPTAAIRRAKSRPLPDAPGADQERPLVRLSFDAAEPPPAVSRWPDGIRRESVALSFRADLRDLRARSEGRSVTLRWAAAADDVEAFVVERSPDGRSFRKVATLEPSTARRGSAADVPEFIYTDEDVQGQVVYYRIRQRRADGSERTTGTIKMGLGASREAQAPVQLIGNFPNPFSKTTTVAYEVREARPVTLTVWDLTGHRITQLADGTKSPGYHEVSFSAADLPSGTYFVRLQTNGRTQSHRMVVLK